MSNKNYRDYLRSLVSEETSSDDSHDSNEMPMPKENFERKRKNAPDENAKKENGKRKRESPENISVDEDDPQEGTSGGPVRNIQQKLENDPEKRTKVGNIFESGMVAYSDKNVEIRVKSVANQQNTRFRTDDHLYQINIEARRRSAPLLLSLETAIREALTFILLRLKKMYAQNLHHQIYLTIIEQNILHGLNTGNFDINSAPNIITNRALTILHSYLKSKQTLRLNNSFKIQIKVLSHKHTQHLSSKPKFKKHVYRDFSRFRN